MFECAECGYPYHSREAAQHCWRTACGDEDWD